MRLAFLLTAAAAAAAAATAASAETCDVIVAGGSLASLAAAVAASNHSATLRVCYLEITDEPGGQLTASAVPAVDFGPFNSVPANLPAPLAAFLFGPDMPGNLGLCWVSKKCFLPALALEGLVAPLLAALPNLRLFLRTAVTGASRDASGAVTAVTAVRRTPAPGTTGWEALTSAQLEDWYSPLPSAAYAKEALTLALAPSGVAIEATEFGDLLAVAGLGFAQGIEVPAEASTTYLSTCGQGMTIPFYVDYGAAPAPSPDPWPPGSGEGAGFQQQGMSWDRDWTYRRVQAPKGASASEGRPGETSVINVGGGNDIGNVYLFLGLGSPELQAQLATPGAWRGGVNASALAAAEQRAYGFWHWFRANASGASGGSASAYLTLNASHARTGTGLSKMPYLRDTRRAAAGLGGFRLFKDNLTAPGAWPRAGVAWEDAIGIGQYFYADIHKESAAFCAYPDYIVSGAPVLPYYLPFRALTVQGAPNVLVAGKAMAQSFFANAATRLHPEEWASGLAAGAAAALMRQRGWTSAQALEGIAEVRAAVVAQGGVLNWTLPAAA
jgi:hypothetical protein